MTIKYHLAFLNYPQIAALINLVTFQIEVVNNKFVRKVMNGLNGANALKLVFSIDCIRLEDQLTFSLAIERLKNDPELQEIQAVLQTLTLQTEHNCNFTLK